MLNAAYKEIARSIFADKGDNFTPQHATRPILGVDLASGATGFTMFYPDTKKHETWDVHVKGRYPHKWFDLKNVLSGGLIKAAEISPVWCFPVVLVENLNFGAKQKREISGAVHAIFQMVLWETYNQVPVYVDIMHAKVMACGRGNADKEAVVNGIRDKYGIDFSHEYHSKRVLDDNKADSYSVARVGEMLLRVACGEKIDMMDPKMVNIIKLTLDSYQEQWR